MKLKTLMKNSHIYIYIYVYIALLGVLSYLIPFIAKEALLVGDDLYFHFNRLLGLSNVFESPVSFDSFAGKGTYVNLYYPWLTMLPMSLIHKVCNSYILAYKIYFLLLGILNFFISYYAMKKITDDITASICFSVIYGFSLYRAINIVYRSALGESISMAFLPLVLLGCYYIFFENQKKWMTLSIAISLIAYTHILSLLLSSAVIILLVAISFYWWNNKKQRIICFIKAVGCSIMLSLGSLIPILYADLTNKTFKPRGYIERLNKSAYRFTDIVNASINNEFFRYSLGLLVIISIFTFIYFIKHKNHKNEKYYKVSYLFFLLACILLVFSSSLIPWSVIGELPIVSVIQFPWRLHAYSTLFFASSTCMLLTFKNNQEKIRFLIVFSIFAIILQWSPLITFHLSNSNRINDDLVEELSVSHGSKGYKDYAPIKSIIYLEENNNNWSLLDSFYLNGKKTNFLFSVEDNGSIFHVDIAYAKKGEIIDIPVFWYTTLHATVNDKEVNTKISDRGTVLIRLPDSGDLSINLYHSYPVIIYVSWIISLVTLVIIVVIVYRRSFM